jgi:hypothetical protein
MNERIKQLAEQATTIVGVEHGCAFDREVIDQEKFAELIIKECLDFLEVGRANGLHIGEVSRGIKQHFGVEE